jgi:Tol biopolymer transport system component
MRNIALLAVVFVATILVCSIGHAANQAVIIQAWDPAHESKTEYNCFWNDCELMWELLDTNKYGRRMELSTFPRERIHMLYADGQDYGRRAWRYDPWRQFGITRITEDAADTLHIRHLLDSLVGVMGSNDTLFVFTFGHGTYNPTNPLNPQTATHSGLVVREDPSDQPAVKLWDTTFARMVGAIQAGHKVLVMSQCYSGGFLDDLAGADAEVVCASKSYVQAQVANGRTKHGSPPYERDILNNGLDTLFHGEFNFHFMNALRGSAVFPYDGSWIVNADRNGDGKVSWKEAWKTADTYDDQERPVYQDTTSWSFAAPVPLGQKNKLVKKGGALTSLEDTAGSTVFAFKGNNTCEFYSYDLNQDGWTTRESIPAYGRSGRKKTVGLGGTLAAGGDGRIYATKGNNSREFWRYTPGADGTGQWWELDSVPGVKRPGSGTAAVAADSTIYLLKGSHTSEFLQYDARNGTWQTKSDAPRGRYSYHTYIAGSCLAYDGDSTIYCLKGRYNDFSSYNIRNNTWTTLESLPFYAAPGSKKTKVGDGAAMVCEDGGVYALKGGRTQEMWRYDPATHKWFVAPNVPVGPSSRPVYSGGSLVKAGVCLWVLRGNGTLDFMWHVPTMFDLGQQPNQDGCATSPGANEVAVATATGGELIDPHWSLQGDFVVYCRPDADSRYQVFRASASGGTGSQLTYLSGDCVTPVVSPSGQTVAFRYMADGSPYSQIAVVPSGGGQATVLTSSSTDYGADGVCWNSSGTGLYYTFDDASSGCVQLGYIAASGGSEQTVTTSSMAHSHPCLLSSTELILEGEDASDGSSQIFRLNLQNGQEVQLTSGSDHENPCCAASARLVGSEVTGDGRTGIAVFSADGGAENVITSGDYDYSAGSICYDGSVLSCIRQGSSGSAVCVYDLVEGTCQVLTDALADREAPDVQVLNSAQHLVSTTYTREGDVYKADYLSSSGLVIAPNGFKAGIARDPNGYVHSVYSGSTIIRHEVRDQNGTCIRQDTPGYGDSPSLSMTIAGDAVVVFRKGDSIFGAVQRANNSWKRVLLYSAPASHHVGPPASAAFQVSSGRFINCCVPCYDSCATGTSMILFLQADTLGNVVLDTLDLCTGSYADSSVCMVVNSASNAIEACYVRSESTFYRSNHLSPTDSTRPVLWTSPSRVNDSATTGRNPTCERRNGRFYIAFSEHWIDGKSGAPMWSIVRASCCDTVSGVTWEGKTPVSTVDSSHKDWPSISLTRVSWAESSSAANYWTIKANIADSLLTLSPDTSCVSCALLSDSTVLSGPATAMTRLRLVWLQKYGSSGDTWQVPSSEREVYASSAGANVTMYNQGRKLCLDSAGSSTDSIRVVFRSNQSSLWIARKKDGDETWNSSLLRSTGDVPAIDQSQGRIWCCCRDVSTMPPGNVIRCQNRAIGSSTWHDFQVYFTSNPNPSSPRLGPPAIVASLYDTSGQNHAAAYIIFTAYTPTLPKSAVVILKVDTAGNVIWTDTLHSVASLADSFADVALSAVAGKGFGIDASFQSTLATGGICYRKTTDLDQPQYKTKRSWSPSYNVMTGMSYRHPTLAASAETVLVAFVAGDSGRILTRGQAPGSSYNVWDDTVNVSQCKDTFTDWPSIALGESIIVSYQKRLSSTNYDVMARVNFHGSINLSNTPGANSKYPHVAFHLHNDSFPVITAIWTEEQGPTTAEVGYKRWQLGLEGGGGIQDYSIFNPNIRPALYAPAPNPFSHSSSIRFSTNIRGLTRVSIMDITGRRVRNLLSTVEKPGVYNLAWNARDDRERRLAGGVYFVRLLTPNYHETRKVIMTQ